MRRGGPFCFLVTKVIRVTRSTPTDVPASLTAGDSWAFDISTVGYSADDGWAASLLLRGHTDFTSEAAHITSAGSSHQVRIPASATAALKAGTYTYALVVSRTVDDVAERKTVRRGSLRVRANPATEVNSLTQLERDYAVIVSVLSGRVTADIEGYTIEGRSVTKIPIAQLEKIRGRYARRIRAARNKGKLGRTVGVRFAPGA